MNSDEKIATLRPSVLNEQIDELLSEVNDTMRQLLVQLLAEQNPETDEQEARDHVYTVLLQHAVTLMVDAARVNNDPEQTFKDLRFMIQSQGTRARVNVINYDETLN